MEITKDLLSLSGLRTRSKNDKGQSIPGLVEWIGRDKTKTDEDKKNVLARRGLRQRSLDDELGRRIPASARWLGERRTLGEQQSVKNTYNKRYDDLRQMEEEKQRQTTILVEKQRQIKKLADWKELVKQKKLETNTKNITGKKTKKTKKSRHQRRKERVQQRRQIVENQTSVPYYGYNSSKSGDITSIENLNSNIFGETRSWYTGETPFHIKKEINNEYKKKIKEKLLESLKKYTPVPCELLETFRITVQEQDKNNPNGFKWAIINDDEIFKKKWGTFSFKRNAEMHPEDKAQYIDNMKIAVEQVVESSILNKEESLREKLIKLYENIDNLDVTSDEFVEVERLIIELSRPGKEIWKRMMFSDNIEPDQDYTLSRNLRNAIKLKDDIVFFFELGERCENGINQMLMEKRKFMKLINSDAVEHQSGKSTSLPLGVLSFLTPTEMMNVGTTSKIMNTKTRNTRQHIFQKKKNKKGGTRNYKFKSKRKKMHKRKSRKI